VKLRYIGAIFFVVTSLLIAFIFFYSRDGSLFGISGNYLTALWAVLIIVFVLTGIIVISMFMNRYMKDDGG